MTHKLYVIFDAASDSVIGGVHAFPHDAVAVRMFGEIASNPQTDVCKYPKDFSLRCVGVIDLSTGVIIPRRDIDTVMSAELFKAVSAGVEVES